MRTLVINTGGTIGMVQTSDGFAPKEGVVETAVAALQAGGHVQGAIDTIALDPLIDGALATPASWNTIVRTITRTYGDYDGFVVIHGTDTLAYSAAALCMALRGMEKPVIVTGAMLPLTVEGSDGRRNLGDALNAATVPRAGIWVQFAGSLLHGGRVRKSHSSALDAFEAAPSTVAPLVPAPGFDPVDVLPRKVGVFSVTPGVCVSLLAFAIGACDGLVLRCYGSGTAPDTPDMRHALAQARDQKVPIIAVSQCPEGGIRLGTYAAGKVMRDTGVIDGRDITPEMAYVKMHYALSLLSGHEDRCAFLAKSLCGELTEDPVH